MQDCPIHTRKITLMDHEDMSSNIDRQFVQIDDVASVAGQLIWENGVGLVGSVLVQVSIDGEHWADVGAIPIATNSGNFVFTSQEDAHLSFLSFSYTATAGSGELTILVNEKIL